MRAPGPAALSAAVYWQLNGCNALADAGDLTAITKRVNGGLIGLANRQAAYARAKPIFGG